MHGGREDMRGAADVVWGELAPELKSLSREYKALICAGTAPFFRGQILENRALLWADGREIRYSKNHLTPWETDFTPGRNIPVFKWRGLRVAPLICFDVEFPEVAARLKKSGVDLILCPSATSDFIGSERVHRCASARAVELGAVVMVSPLVGRDLKNALVDVNVGSIGVYYPSQEVFRGVKTVKTSLYTSGWRAQSAVIDFGKVRAIKGRSKETRPFVAD